MLFLLLLVVVAAMALYEPWSVRTAVPTSSTRSETKSNRHQAPNDWRQLFANVLYRQAGEETHRS